MHGICCECYEDRYNLWHGKILGEENERICQPEECSNHIMVLWDFFWRELCCRIVIEYVRESGGLDAAKVGIEIGIVCLHRSDL